MEQLAAEIKALQGKQEHLFANANAVLDYSKRISKKDKKTLNNFKVKIQSLDLIRATFIDTVERLQILRSEENADYQVNYQPVDSFLEVYGTIKSAYEELEFLVNPPPPPPLVVPGTPPASSSAPRSDPPAPSVKAKLPTLDLPVFSGDSSEWVVFYELFRSMIHERTDLSDAQRCQYLLSRLSGKALACCSSIPATPDNYNIILQTLVDKYNDKRVLASNYLDLILNYKPSKTESVVSLNNFVEKFGTAVSALKALDINDLSDIILVHLASGKLSPDTVRLFERSLQKDEMPTFKKMLEFVKEQAKILNRVQPTSGNSSSGPSGAAMGKPVWNPTKPRVSQTFLVTDPASSGPRDCLLCQKGTHFLYRCPKFHSMAPRDRYNLVKNEGQCLNCLGHSHSVKECPSKGVCSKCSKRHHSLLHFPVINIGPPREQPVNDQPPKGGSTTCAVSTYSLVGRNNCTTCETILLSTVQVLVHDKEGNKHKARFLLDSGSQSHFITRKFCNQLNLACGGATTTVVSGLGSSSKPVLGESVIKLESRFSSTSSYLLNVLVVDTITDKLPSAPVQMNSDALRHLRHLNLSDDSFGTPGEIQGLIGAALYPYLLIPGQVLGDPPGPIALNTTLGYVVVGAAPVFDNLSTKPFCGFVQTQNLETLVQRFWENEEIVSPDPILSRDEMEAEEHFQANCRFDIEKSRYCVRLPFKEPPSNLGSSGEIALSRFLSLERKLERNLDLRRNYDQAITDLLKSDYLEICPNDDGKGYYVPHHVVVKESSLTTKYRIVFDFSCPSDNGKSLNDIVHSGPKLYNDLFNILLNLRLFKIALIADISKMFLQILLDYEDCPYQKIFWRFSPNDPIQVYFLNRVTFGNTASPYLSQRVIRQLALDNEKEFPLVKPVVFDSFYMDDLTTSVMELDQALELHSQLVNCFKKASFDLVKWASNSPEFVGNIAEDVSISSLIDWDANQSLKILGMGWNPTSDLFSFQVDVQDRPCTKRLVLSNLAKIWDPLGLISPVTLYCKVILQSLWNLKLDWDETAPPEISYLWKQIIDELKLLSEIKIPRHISVVEGSKLTLIGYCDASEKACAAVVYTKVQVDEHLPVVTLLAAKSKVAPLKKISIPRLELNAALLLARLISLILEQYTSRYPVQEVVCLSDSTIALHWINSSAHKWQTYVANRVTKIQELIPPDRWYHVAGSNNESADCLSRGLTPSQMVAHSTWFQGPSYLLEEVSSWPISKLENSNGPLPEEKRVALLTAQPPRPFLLQLAERFSSWKKLVNTLVFVFRFIKKLPRRIGIEVADVEFVEKRLWLAIQKSHFHKLDAFQKLTPFKDEEGLVRVGGRLHNASLNYGQKHPLLLPKNEHVVHLLITHVHQSNLHTGPSLLLSILRQKYWILAARPLVRKLVQSCTRCFRFDPKSNTPLMGDLPKFRVQEVKPFTNTGVDFAGPFSITLSKHRGVRTQKAYLCLFICLATKALHLELVSDLSKEAFVNALKRFLARRGPVSCMYSDNGTNFIATKNMLDELYKFLNSPEFTQTYGKEMVDNRISWKTLPPAAPHMAGIWERAVRSVKTHLYKVIGCQILTFEELTTVLTQIEALLNSRPLCVLSNDPNDLEPLTPAHFLKMTPLHHLPSVQLEEDRLTRLSRFQLLDQMVQSFWKRWSLEYLNSLQEKSKWNKSIENLAVGTVVLIKDGNAIPLHWKLGVVQEVHPGSDGVVRVATVKTKSGVYKRPVVKLCPLPTQ
ncbi:hypothetical protein M8J77_018916 [Diaphorina citri]|nr:hypothetical protein M8J77_018916 [Diaphorina citri]